jgi:hypothetical protein
MTSKVGFFAFNDSSLVLGRNASLVTSRPVTLLSIFFVDCFAFEVGSLRFFLVTEGSDVLSAVVNKEETACP